jgi:hypothetical protein
MDAQGLVAVRVIKRERRKVMLNYEREKQPLFEIITTSVESVGL